MPSSIVQAIIEAHRAYIHHCGPLRPAEEYRSRTRTEGAPRSPLRWRPLWP
ncbi:hypothetical protein [Streptomyces sp. NPDC058653]|uniref:hypothetical protein n=1 Tax=Streptomyces sp. NPDC058653 TaxID=3346576 RepID=UPI00364CBD0F